MTLDKSVEIDQQMIAQNLSAVRHVATEKRTSLEGTQTLLSHLRSLMSILIVW